MPPRAQLRCPRCGTPVQPFQDSCLQCGAPLPQTSRVVPVLGAAWRRLLPWYPGDWIWPVLALALLTVASTAAALGARDARRSATPTLVATNSHVTVSIGSTTAPTTAPPTVSTTVAPTVPQPTISTGTLPVAPGSPSTSVPTTTAPPATTAPPPTTPSAIRSWPSGTSGWTDVLESLPESAGRPAAVARARSAYRAGVQNVGVLLSSQYSSLHAGYWVVFAGVYASQAQAQTGLAAARARGFAGAYPAQVAP